MNMKMRKYVAVTACVTIGALVGTLTHGFTHSDLSSVSSSVTVNATMKSLATISDETTNGTTAIKPELNLEEYVGNIGTLSVNTTTNVGYYVVMPWATQTIKGEYKYRETTGSRYRELGWLKSFSQDICEGNGVLSLDFAEGYDVKANVSYTEDDLTSYLGTNNNFESLEVGDTIKTDREGIDVVVVEKDGERALQVEYDNNLYTAKVSDIDWYVIKTAPYTNWHVDGSVKWEKTPIEETTEPETETETEKETETEEKPSIEESKTVEKETPFISEVAGDEDNLEEDTEIETITVNTDSLFYGEVAGDEDVVLANTVVSTDDSFYGEVAGDEDVVALNSVQTGDSNVIMIYAVVMLVAIGLIATSLVLKKTENN